MEDILHKMNDILTKLKDKGENDLALKLEGIILDIWELRVEHQVAEMNAKYEELVSKLNYEH